MAIAAEILTVLRANASQFKAEVASAQGTTESFAGGLSKTAVVGGAAFAVLGAAAVAVGVIGVKAALDYETAHARLTAAIKNSGSTWKDQGDRVEALDSKMRNLGFTDTDTEGSLSSLVVATKDTAKATDLMGLAADIARGRHIDLASATAILVKVEAGRVGLLGRLGLQTKDATGATISQTQAIKELTAYYGGQAAAYTDTFAGKLQTLEAQLDHIAVQIGQALIPVITDLAGALADTIDFFERNTQLAIALSAAVGGPLVYAMGAFVVAAVSAAATNLAAFWVTALAELLNFTDALIFNTAAWEAQIATADAAVGVYLADAAGMEAVSASAEGATASIAGMGAVLIPLVIGGVIIGGIYALTEVFFGLADSVSKATVNGRQFADFMVKGIVDTHNTADAFKEVTKQANDNSTALKFAKQTVSDLAGQYTALYRDASFVAQLNKDQLKTWNSANDAIDQLTATGEVYRAALSKLGPEVAKLRAEQEKQLASANLVAQSYGITIPNASSLSSTALKSLQSALSAAGAVFDRTAIQTALNAGVTGDALKSLVSDANSFATSLEGSINKATDPFAHFGEQAQVSVDEMTNFFVGSQLQAGQWADEITGLIGRGVDLGFIQNMAKAGPGSKPSLDAFVAMVDQHGVDWVNSVIASGQQAAKATEQAYDAMAISTGIHALEMATVNKAAFADMESGGTSHLEALRGSSDKNMVAMAYTALTQIQNIRTAAGTPIPPVEVPVHLGQAYTDVNDFFAYLRGLTHEEYNVVLSLTGP